MTRKNSGSHIAAPRPVFCRHCGGVIDINDIGMKYGDKALCYTCISEITAEEIIRICETTSKAELLYTLGFKRI